jgi:chemotaxis protein methyltransferase CheR
MATASPAHRDTTRDISLEFPFTERDFRFLASIVYDCSGIVLGPGKRDMVYSRLVRRLRELHLPSFRAYCDLLRSANGTDEIGTLINAITTNLTRFFREDHHFEHLRDTVLAEAEATATHTGRRHLRIWSAGCSSGEEPYSIAMTLLQNLPNIRQWNARILATDLDSSMVARAAAGVYGRETASDVPPALRQAYFTASDKTLTASEDMKALITFKQLNLLGTWPMKGPFDVIFCRNVMIYFDNPTKTNLVARYAEMLRPGGWLYVGHSETLLDREGGFTPAGRTIYRKNAP